MNENNKENTNQRLDRIRNRRREKEVRKNPEPIVLESINTANMEIENNLANARKNRKTGNIRWLSAILSAVFGIAAGCYAFLPYFRFDDIKITGMEKISKDEVIYFSAARGKPVFVINPDQVRTTLLQHYQDVYDAKVEISFPAELTIELQERVPMVEWDFGGSRFWIDKDGMVLNESRSQKETIHVYADSYPGAPSQEDRNLPMYFSKDVLKTIVTMGSLVPEDKPLIFTYKHGFGWDTDEGWRIFFGKTDSDMDEKLRMQASLTKYFTDEEIQPILVSLEFKDAPYYRFVEN